MSLENASLYGKGFFTTIRVADGRPLFWDKHWRRLVGHSDRLGISISQFSERALLAEVNEKIAAASLVDGRVRITFSDSTPSEIWAERSEIVTSVSIIVAGSRPLPQEFRLGVSENLVNSCSPLTGLKTCNYLDKIIALDDAVSRGFNEAVMTNERGHITSGCMSNIFWVSGDRLYTPALTTGCLAGTTREYVLENTNCEEIETDISVLEIVDAIYLTSAGLGVVSVAKYNGRAMSPTEHPISLITI